MKASILLMVLFTGAAQAGPIEDLYYQTRPDAMVYGVMWFEWGHGSQDAAICCWWALHYASVSDWTHALDFGELAYALATTDLNRAIIAVAYWEWFGKEQEKLKVPDLGLIID